MEDLFGLGKLSTNSMDVIKMVYPDLAQPAVKKVGSALETVLELSNTILLPLKLLNEKGAIMFKRHMDKYEANLDKFPEEDITPVHPSLGLKILDELFTVTNDDIADLFVNLLTHASTVSGAKYAHPGFVEVIKNLSEDEARIINEIYRKDQEVKYVYLAKNENGGTARITDKLSDLTKLTEIKFEENSQFYMDNLMKLGLVYDDNTVLKAQLPALEELEELQLPQKKNMEDYVKKSQTEGRLLNVSIISRRGRYELTAYGKRFIECVSRD